MTVIILGLAVLICGVGCGGLLTGRGGGEEVKEIESPGFRSPEVGISFYVCYCVMTSTPRKMEYKSVGYAQIFSKPPFGDLKLLKAFNFISQGTLLY